MAQNVSGSNELGNDGMLPDNSGPGFDEGSCVDPDAQNDHAMAAKCLREGDPFLRAELESRILADQPIAEIALAMNQPPEVIARYEDDFFYVRNRLKNSNWIFSVVIGHQRADDAPVDSVGWLWRRIGYELGMIGLEPLLSAADRKELAHQGLRAYLHDKVSLPAEYKFFILAQIMPVPRSTKDLRKLNRLVAKMMSPRREMLDLAAPLEMTISPAMPPASVSTDSAAQQTGDGSTAAHSDPTFGMSSARVA